MDTLELIRTFREVAHRGSFSAAAGSLGLSRPNVSKYVAELESRVGVRLLNRTTRNVSLTDAGSLLLERSTPLIEMIELTRSELQNRAREPSGRLRISAPHGLAQTQLPQLLGEFMRRHPAVTPSLHVDNRLIDMVEEGVDLAIRVGRIGDANLIVRKLQTVPFVVAASPTYWSARGRPRQPDELAGHDALTFSVLGLQPQWQFVIDNQLVAVPVNSRADASDAAPLIDLARQGLGMVWMPRLLLAPHLENGSLQAVLEEFTVRDIWLYAAYAQRRHNSAAMRAMLSLLESHWRQD